MEPIISFTDQGIYCPAGDFFIDPWKPVPYAVITHAHADHSRPGNGHYLAHEQSEPIMRLRLGTDISLQTLPYGKIVQHNGVKISLHPAGHIIGSSQVRIEHKGQVTVISGDYKTTPDAVCTPFEPVKCHQFVTESTFGLPIYQWEKEEALFQKINAWWKANKEEGKNSMLLGYALGKAQRILSGLNPEIGEIFVHGAIHSVNQALSDHFKLPYQIQKIDFSRPKGSYQGVMMVAPPSVLGSNWARKLQPYATAMCSGWMAVRGLKKRRGTDTGFVLSDHADWAGLNDAVMATEAEKVFVTHGFSDIFSRHLREKGIDAQVVETLYQGDTGEDMTEDFHNSTL